jgi:hypothetical protein
MTNTRHRPSNGLSWLSGRSITRSLTGGPALAGHPWTVGKCAVVLGKFCTTSNYVLGREYRRSFRDVIQGAHPLHNDAPMFVKG